MPLKRDALDALFSDAVRESADWLCQRCGKQFPERKGQDIHCSHYFSRKFNATRWFPDNAACLCATCHAVVTDDPDAHYKFFFLHLGQVRYDWLVKRKHEIKRYRANDKKDMRVHFRNELERLRQMRKDGVMGAINLVAWD